MRRAGVDGALFCQAARCCKQIELIEHPTKSAEPSEVDGEGKPHLRLELLTRSRANRLQTLLMADTPALALQERAQAKAQALPSEIWLRVLRLPTLDYADLKRFSRTCRRFHGLEKVRWDVGI